MRPAGKYVGLSTICPTCGEHAPKELEYNYRKWRWLAAHQAVAHNSK